MKLLIILLLLLPIVYAQDVEEIELGKPPELSSTGYTIKKGEYVTCWIKMPDNPLIGEKYGGAVGLYSTNQDIRIYAVAKGFIRHTPRLEVYENSQLKTHAEFEENQFNEEFQVRLAYLNDGTIKIGYRYATVTEWQILYSVLAKSSMYSVKGLKAYKCEKRQIAPPSPPSNGNNPFDDSEPFDKSDNKKYLLAAGALIIIALILLVTRK